MLKTIAASCAAALMAVAGSATAQSKCVLQEIGELPLSSDGGDLVVEAAINGVPVKMIVDTGSMATSLFRSTADKLGLRMKPIAGVTFYGAGGSDVLNEVGVKELKVGNLTARNMDMAVLGRRTMGDVGGLLGAGFLFQADLEIDAPEGKLRFFKPTGCTGDQVVYWQKAYAVVSNVSPDPDLDIQIMVKLGGAPIRATLDSGASTSVVYRAAADRFGDNTVARQAEQSAIGIGKQSVEQEVATFPSFSFGDETIRNAKLSVADVFKAGREVRLGSRIAKAVVDEPDMLLGADFFRSHRVYISKGQKKIYASYMGGPVFDVHRPLEAPAAAKPASAASPP
jgi:clan AA aspartic protease (TIGR02281 family)